MNIEGVKEAGVYMVRGGRGRAGGRGRGGREGRREREGGEGRVAE